MRMARSGFVAMSLAIGCLLTTSAALQAQEAAKPVTFDDLQRTTIKATVIYAQTIRRLDNDRLINNTNEQNITLRIGPGEAIDQIHSVTITAPNGHVVGSNSFPGQFSLNKPRKGRFGEIIWLFDEGKLVRLQIFESGGRRITLSFKRMGAGLTCGIDAPFAREEGGGAMQTNAAVGGMKIQMLNVKQTSSNCRVEKGSGS